MSNTTSPLAAVPKGQLSDANIWWMYVEQQRRGASDVETFVGARSPADAVEAHLGQEHIARVMERAKDKPKKIAAALLRHIATERAKRLAEVALRVGPYVMRRVASRPAVPVLVDRDARRIEWVEGRDAKAIAAALIERGLADAPLLTPTDI